MSHRLSSWLLCLFCLFSSLSVAQTTLTVAAAADLSPLEASLASSFRNLHPDLNVKWVTSASGVLTQQIRSAAPYDVFLSANAAFVDQLATEGKLQPDSVRTYATGRLGLLWRDGQQHPLEFVSQNSVRVVALPNPKLAPYGVAAQQSLEHAGLWSKIQGKIVYGENVRQTLELLTTGNADAVLTSDSLLRDRKAQIVPDDTHAPILQKGGMVAASRNRAAARTFLDFLTGPAGQAVFAKFGFAAGPVNTKTSGH